MSFSSDVSRIAKDMKLSVEDVASSTFISLFADVIASTPVDQGRLRGNWQTTKNSPASSDVNRIQKQKRTGPATSEAHTVIKKPGVYYLANTMPYAEKIEFGGFGTGPGATEKTTRDGFSIQAPFGMVRVNVKRLDQILRKKARGLN